MKTTHVVRVLGREISVKSSAPPEQVQGVETYVNERLMEIGGALKSGDAQLVLTLALLNTAEEMLALQNLKETEQEAENRLRGILEKLQSV
ncbi:MAG: cell division protein ZapA [Desulfuromonadaceae bacterium]|nr:cell division protein ZapA [Desulfuromonadaceae bacterium]